MCYNTHFLFFKGKKLTYSNIIGENRKDCIYKGSELKLSPIYQKAHICQSCGCEHMFTSHSLIFIHFKHIVAYL